MRIFSLCVALLLFTVAPALAEETAKPSAEKPDIAANPYGEKIPEMAQKLAETMTEEEVNNFVVIKDNFGMIRATGIARTDVKNAVAACAEENTDMADKITARHKEWEKALSAATEKQQKTLDKEIKKRFAHPKDVKLYLDQIDKAANYANEQIEKTPVSDKAACETLLKSMDETQKQIEDLLDGMAWDVPSPPFVDTSKENAEAATEK
ncbi:MAG: hypothetical protein H6868_00475 [Rhodospirillales bacterium]|nr:hypothetical protein [Rhodospirillales bacterium]